MHKEQNKKDFSLQLKSEMGIELLVSLLQLISTWFETSE